MEDRKLEFFWQWQWMGWIWWKFSLSFRTKGFELWVRGWSSQKKNV